MGESNGSIVHHMSVSAFPLSASISVTMCVTCGEFDFFYEPLQNVAMTKSQ